MFMNVDLQRRALIAKMDELYPEIVIVEFFKILAEDGKVLARNGFSEPSHYTDFKVAMLPDIMANAHKRAYVRFAPEIRAKFGREPMPGEIRLAFRPMNGLFRSVFLDDITIKTQAHILIETSRDNWQGHFILGREVTVDVAATLQKHLIGSCAGSSRPTADPGAASPRQARRFPEGRSVYNTLLPPLDVDDLLEKIKASQPERTLNMATNSSSDSADREAHWDDVALDSVWRRQAGNIFDDKKQRDKSYSAVDMAFANYLLGHCQLRDEFVRDALERVSPNIDSRHPKLDDYLDRTISKARLFINKKK
jgi:hypothetical protein